MISQNIAIHSPGYLLRLSQLLSVSSNGESCTAGGLKMVRRPDIVTAP